MKNLQSILPKLEKSAEKSSGLPVELLRQPMCEVQAYAESLKNKRPKTTRIIEQLKQYLDAKEHFDHYAQNCLRILFGSPTIDYRYISHDNLLVHS